MANVTMSINAERWLDEVVLFGSQTDVGADTNNEYALPAGFGDCAILNATYLAINIATLVAPTDLGICARVLSLSTATMEAFVFGPFLKVAANRVVAFADPQALVLWRQDEKLVLIVPEVDSNASPTDDHQLFVKVVRVRPLEGPIGPIQLVR